MKLDLTKMNLLYTVCISILLCPNYTFVSDYSPRIYMDKNEEFFPSDVKYFESYTHLKDNWVITNDPVETPSSILPFFYGQNVSTNPVLYALIFPSLNESDPIMSLKYPYEHNITVVYFTFYPYNKGKDLFYTLWENHVGDIEHVSVEFSNGVPQMVSAYYHTDFTIQDWNSVEKVDGTNHFVVYSARGSHGLWFTEGTHGYSKINPLLVDYTSKGDNWDTWNNLVMITPYDWSTHIAYYTTWMTKIFRWGNPSSDFSTNNCYFGFCRFVDGPEGILAKQDVRAHMEVLRNQGYACDRSQENNSVNCIWDSGIW